MTKITELLKVLALLEQLAPRAKRFAKVIEKPQHTRNLFGPISEIAGKRLEVLERNDEGDCLCLFSGVLGTNIVDVDRRDIEPDQNSRS